MGIITQYNYIHGKWAEETVNTTSETQPDQSYSIQELLLRFATGTAPDIIRKVHYDDGLSGSDIDQDFERDDPTDNPDFDLVDAYAYQVAYNNPQVSPQDPKSIVEPIKPESLKDEE